MSVTTMQGFELIKPTADYGTAALVASEVSKYLGFDVLTADANWFVDNTNSASLDAGPVITATGARIDGQCLLIQRPDAGAYNDDFNAKKNLGLSQYITSTSTLNFGFALKYSKRPTQPIPLLVFNYDNGVEVLPQTTLWLGVTGSLFFSSEVFSVTEAAPSDPVPIDALTTSPGSIIFDKYMYIEGQISLAGDSSVASLSVNGDVLIEQVTAGALQSYVNRNYINQVILVNPMADYFSGPYNMFIDDLYYGNAISVNAGLLGPQHIKRFELTAATATTNWTGTGAASNYECVNSQLDPSGAGTSYISAASSNLLDYYELADVPPAYTTVNCMKVTAKVSVDDGVGAVSLRAVYDGDINHNTSVLINIPDNAEQYVRSAIFNKVYDNEITVARMNTMWVGVIS